jgi:hypothetical protein
MDQLPLEKFLKMVD